MNTDASGEWSGYAREARGRNRREGENYKGNSRTKAFFFSCFSSLVYTLSSRGHQTHRGMRERVCVCGVWVKETQHPYGISFFFKRRCVSVRNPALSY